jgi:hypothetical protein
MSTSITELRAAAELVVGQPVLCRCNKTGCRRGAAVAVARAFLAEHLADDAEPVTEGWLQAAGFVRACFELLAYGYHHKAKCWSVSIRPSRDRGQAENVDVRTRGDVRRLLRAFGIEVKV